MQLGFGTYSYRVFGTVVVLAAGLMGLPSAFIAAASEAMPVAQQNALVRKYCAVCHTDAARNGGLSLQHFDAAQIDPSLAAMLLSKLKGGALGAAGLPVPDQATEGALKSALVSASVGAHEWTVREAEDPATKQRVLTASILRELPAAKNAGQSSLYRLVLACNAATERGEMQLSWSPSPKKGTLTASWDGDPPLTYQVDGDEKMGNGTPGTTGPAALVLYPAALASGQKSSGPKLVVPRQALTIGKLFPGETVVFPFDALTQQTRQALATCFAESRAGR